MKLGDGCDLWTPDPGTVPYGEEDTVRCGVCGGQMDIKRNQLGPTSWAGSLAGHKRVHDFICCPHREDAWHKQAKLLSQLGRDTPSPTLRDIYRKDFVKIIKDNVK